MMAIINPGDEVVVFEPFYENYGPDAILCGATPRFVKLRPPDWTFDPEELAAAFGPATKAIILNTPNNPTGHVFERAELEFIRDLCQRWNAFAITDEIYEHIVYDGARHISLATLDGMRDRTITINALSKTYSVTGWRVGWAIAPPDVTAAIRKVHDFLTVGAAAPLAGSRHGGDAVSAQLLRNARARIRRPPRPHDRNPHRRGLPLLQAPRRLLHHDRHLRASVFPTTWPSPTISSRKSAWPACPAPASIAIPPTAARTSASPSAKPKRPSRPPPSASPSSRLRSPPDRKS